MLRLTFIWTNSSWLKSSYPSFYPITYGGLSYTQLLRDTNIILVQKRSPHNMLSLNPCKNASLGWISYEKNSLDLQQYVYPILLYHREHQDKLHPNPIQSLQICMFAVFRKDILEDYNHSLIKIGHNSPHGHFPILAVMARSQYGHKYGLYRGLYI